MIWVDTGSGSRPFFCDVGLDARVDIGEGADRTRNRAGRGLLACGDEALAVARELGVMPGELQPERRRLGMHAVAAGDHRRQLVLEGSLFEHRQHRIEVGAQQVGGLSQLHREASVEDVARRHTLVYEARLGANMLGEVGQKRDRLVMHLALDVEDARDVKGAALAHRLCSALRNDAELFLRLAGKGLDVELDAEIVIRLPDLGHLQAAVPRDHDRLTLSGETDAARQRGNAAPRRRKTLAERAGFENLKICTGARPKGDRVTARAVSPGTEIPR